MSECTHGASSRGPKQVILDTVWDLAVNFLIYDRKEDEDLNPEQLQSAIQSGLISLDEIVEHFRVSLQENLGMEF